MRTIPRSSDVFPELRKLVSKCNDRFIAIGVAFDRSLKHHQDEIEKAIRRGVTFEYVTLAQNADLALFAHQFNQTVDELKAEITSSEATLTRLRDLHPGKFSFHPTKKCPNYRIYVADPDSDNASGIIVFYASKTDSPNLPAIVEHRFAKSPLRAYLDDARRAVSDEQNRRVFIIHGHDEARWRELQRLLEDINLEPVVMSEAPQHGSSTLIDKFESLAETCAYAIAIGTADDLVSKEGHQYYQPRPNVSFEIGWFSSHLGRRRVLLLMQESEGMQIFSDFSGVGQLRFQRSIKEIFLDIQRELSAQHLLD